MDSCNSVAAWHELPSIIERVLRCLTTNKDVLRAEAVCRAWRDVRVALPSVVHVAGQVEGPQLKMMTAHITRIRSMKLYLTDNTNQGQRFEVVRLLNRAGALAHLDISDSSGLSLPDNFEHLSSLQQLTIQNCPNIKALPATIGSLQQLQYLKIHNCRNIRVLWISTTSSQPFGQLSSLRSLSVSRCRSLERMPDLGPLGGLLQRLTIIECSGMAKLPPGLDELTALQDLKIGDLPALTALPDLQQLQSLRSFTIYGCESLTQLPDDLGQLSGLTQLTLNSCPQLKQLPATFGYLSSLQQLTLSSCNGLSTKPGLAGLPYSIGMLSNLQQLVISDFAKLLTLPSSTWYLQRLEQLTIARCVVLWELPPLPEGLQNSSDLMHCLKQLTISDCQILSELPEFLGQVTALEKLFISNCPFLSALPDSLAAGGLCGSLRQLMLDNCGIKRLPENLGNLKALQNLSLCLLNELRALPSSVVHLTELRTLSVCGCDLLQCWPVDGWDQMVSLQQLDFWDCKSLQSLPRGLGSLPNLRELSVSSCDHLHVVPEEVMRLSSLQLN